MTKVRHIAVSVLLASVLAATQTLAADAKSYAGAWRLLLHSKRCSLQFGTKRAFGGFTLTQNCSDDFPMQSVRAWRPTADGIVFLSDTGAPVVTFEETEEIYLDSNNPDLVLRRSGP